MNRPTATAEVSARSASARRSLRAGVAAASAALMLAGAAIATVGAAPAEAATLKCTKTVTAEAATRCFYKAWRNGSPKAAKKVAGADAIAELFSVRQHRMYFGGCTQIEATAWQCDLNANGERLTMDVVRYGGRTMVDGVSWGSAS